MAILKFEDVVGWQKSQELAIVIFDKFTKCKNWDFKNQICRASVSISNNIAEGFDRCSNAEFRKFLYYSLASCSEVKSMLYLSEKLGYLSNRDKNDIMYKTIEIARILNGLIRSLKSNKV